MVCVKELTEMMTAPKISPRHYRTLRKKKKMRSKIAELTTTQIKSPETKSVILTLLVLTLVFAVIAYFKP
jgi:hypothetical protein